MLVLCYGMQKSGSTLAFEMVSAILQSAGHEQAFVYNDMREPDGGKTRRNFIAKVTRENVETILHAIGPDRTIAVKTHSGFDNTLFPWLEELQAARALQVIATYRDPRDICLSLLDAGERARTAGKGFFQKFETLEDAGRFARGSILRFRKWAALRGTLRLNYETVAHEPKNAISAIEAVLGVRSDRDRVMTHAFEDAFTQKNKAARTRYREEMTVGQQAWAAKTFSKFLKHACESDDQSWCDRHREKILAESGKAPDA